MTREEAQREASRLNGERPPGSTYRWLARGGGAGEWSIMKVGDARSVKTTTEAKPKPPQADDPRTSFDRNVGGPWIG